jgi:predicted small secreted protein
MRTGLLAGLLALGALALLASCNTVEGLGQDLQQGGARISDTARDVEEEM